MKKRLTILTLIFSLTAASLLAQAPQAFSYQAVATDNLGKELANQAIGIRASILQGSPSGQAVWVETHAVTTDDFGLFTISVGQGTGQSGPLPSFSSIDWSTGTYFLRIDMDAAGGTNYAFVGASQLLSVPYALYAERSGSAVRASYADSTAVSAYAHRAAIADSAVIAREALLAQRAVRADSAGIADLAVLAANAYQADYAENAGNAASTAFANYAGVAQYAELAGTALDDNDTDPANELQTLSMSRDTIRISNGNFISLNAVSPFNAPGATLDFPEGTENAFFLYIFNSYTVPAGRNFYITASQSEVRLPGVGNALGRHFTTPSQPIIPGGTTVSNCRCTGFLVNQTSQINPVVIVLQPNGANSYQVPTGRYLVIKSGVTAAMPVSFDGTVIDFFSSTVKAMVAPSGVTLRNPNSEEIILTGYLKNNN